MPRKPRGIFQRPPGSGIWWIDYHDADGRRHRERIGPRSAAIDARANRLREIEGGRFVSPGSSTHLTFRQLAARAMAQKQLRVANSSYATDMHRLGKLLPLLGDIPATRLTPGRIEETLTLLRQSGNEASTVNRYRALLSSIYSIAVRNDLVAVNPVKRVKPYPENLGRIRWLQNDEETLVRAAIDTPTHVAEFDLSLNTGMRRGEQWGLRWRDVNFEQRVATVDGKTGQRHIALSTMAIDALRRLQVASGGQEFVCPEANSERGARRDWRTWFEDACSTAGIDDFRFHDIRHTFCSRLAMSGVDLRTIQVLAGHKGIAMTMRYAHLSPGHQQEAVERLNRHAAAVEALAPPTAPEGNPSETQSQQA